MTDFDLFKPIKKELNLVEGGLISSIDTKLDLLNAASTHLARAGGKRIRPAFTLLSARLFSDSVEKVIPMAIALELIHMASLVHDDVIDNSNLRRGQPTVKNEWGNRVSVYSGNYVFARSLSIVSQYKRSDVVLVIADASMRICEGEIRQMLSCYDVNQGLKDYLRRIERKTALLISVSCQLGAMISNADASQIRALKRYGYYLGMAFQVTDDILDFVANANILGKPVGSDIRQGVITLPAIYALRYDSHREKLSRYLSSPELSASHAGEIVEIISESDGIGYAYQVSCKFSTRAKQQLQLLPNVPERQALYDIADYMTNRQY